MKWWMFFYEELKGFYNGYTFLLVLCIGLFILFVDRPNLMKKRLKREANICKWTGRTYIFLGIIAYIVVKIF
ncbi:hypothetical protein IZY60_02890 [Lutibacter sp. B2]|nr:hypothetical protein [Lutibacter sp. B2]